MCPLEGLHYSGRHELSFPPGWISLRGVLHHYQATEKIWVCNVPVLSVPYLINLLSGKNSVLKHCYALLCTFFPFFSGEWLLLLLWFIGWDFRILEKQEQVRLLSLLPHKDNRREWLFSDGPESQASALKSLQLPCQLNQFTRWSPKVSMSVEEDVYACYEGSWEQSRFCQLWRENSNYFLKFYLFTLPVGSNDPSFPHQDVVPSIDPCSAFVSPAAGAEQQPSVGRAIESPADFSNRKSHQCPHHRWESPAWPQETSWRNPARTEGGSSGYDSEVN